MTELTERQNWMAMLAKASVQELEALVSRVEGVPEYRFLRSPETGLTMVRGRAGGVGQVFNLGEMTLTRCVVQIAAGQSDAVTGFGYVGGRSHRHAELAALCDGLLQHDDWHEEIWDGVIEPLGAIARNQREQQQQQTAATKVDFFTLLRGE
ncbi:MAG: phosphonate C-P lyase system protein PhnG [Phormidesmis sp.]